MPETPEDALTPRDVIAAAVVGLAAAGSAGRPVAFAEAVLESLEREGFTILPTPEWERLDEIRASAEGHFPRCVLIKPDRDADYYVGWSNVVEAPVWAGTKADAIAWGCARSRLRRADVTGTSQQRDPGSTYDGPLDGAWDDKGFIAEQRGWLPRARLGAYVRAYVADRMDEACDLLEPFEGETEVRRG